MLSNINYFEIFNGNLYLNNNYLKVLICFFIAAGLSFFIMIFYKLITANTIYIDTLDKVSGFECGFSPFSESRSKFYIKFYLVAVIFLLFDLEIVLLFPLVPVLLNIALFNFIIFWIFILFTLMIWLGIYYEFKKNILDWF